MRLQSLLSIPLLLSAATCHSSPVESSFCVVVSTPPFDSAALVTRLDEYSDRHALNRRVTDLGAMYASPDKEFVINVMEIGPLGTEVAFFPKEPGTFKAESAAFEQFVKQNIANQFSVKRCEVLPDYHKSQIYGYDQLAI